MTSQPPPFISICIPAYKRTHYLKRLLDSIAVQSFQDFEVIISDDSNDDSVKLLIGQYTDLFTIRYYKNEPALGTPANWNFGISKATGEWIKIMHDDDWFATSRALQTFADATAKGKKFIVSNYNNIDDNGNILSKPALSAFRKKILQKNPMVLLSENYIGQPSVCLIHRSLSAKYDERMKWRVDIDFYIQLLLAERSFTHIGDVLINIGISSTQVTHSCLNVPDVELPEGWLLLQKYGTSYLKNILVYDAWWRIIRNTKTRNKETLYRYASSWPKAIEQMVERQSRLTPSQLQQGVISKFHMMMNYMNNAII